MKTILLISCFLFIGCEVPDRDYRDYEDSETVCETVCDEDGEYCTSECTTEYYRG